MSRLTDSREEPGKRTSARKERAIVRRAREAKRGQRRARVREREHGGQAERWVLVQSARRSRRGAFGHTTCNARLRSTKSQRSGWSASSGGRLRGSRTFKRSGVLPSPGRRATTGRASTTRLASCTPRAVAASGVGRPSSTCVADIAVSPTMIRARRTAHPNPPPHLSPHTAPQPPPAPSNPLQTPTPPHTPPYCTPPVSPPLRCGASEVRNERGCVALGTRSSRRTLAFRPRPDLETRSSEFDKSLRHLARGSRRVRSGQFAPSLFDLRVSLSALKKDCRDKGDSKALS